MRNAREGYAPAEARGRQKAIKCEKLPDGGSYLITCSDSQWIAILLSKGIKASRHQVQIALKYNLHLWYSLEIQEFRNTGKKGVPNRVGTKFILRTHAAILARRREKLVTTHGEEDETKSRNYTNGRPNSLRPINPELAGVDGFDLASHPPKGQTEFDVERAAKTQHAPPADGDVARAAAVPPPEPSAKTSEPRRMVEQVPPDQQKILNQLCGCVEGARGAPRYCDLSGEILANAQATALITGRPFPPEKIGDFCVKWIFDNNKKIDKTNGSSDLRHWIWKVDMPAAFMRSQAQKQEIVLGYLDWLDRQKRKADREDHERICKCLQQLRAHPQDEEILEWKETLARDLPELWATAYAEDDRKHGGDGMGSSWPTPKAMSSGSSP